MPLMIDKFYESLNRPLKMGGRLVLALLVVPLVFAFTEPLWRISMTAPQYPKGLYMDVFAYKIEGGDEGKIRCAGSVRPVGWHRQSVWQWPEDLLHQKVEWGDC